MNILYKEEKSTHDCYTFSINHGGVLDLRVSNGSPRHVTIHFLNGKFDRVESNIEEGFLETRSGWHVKGAIAEKIKEIEARYQPQSLKDRK